ncbi:hypothetical protein QEM02_003753 [Pseudomonas putida]|nr:hypothetical protein [Pseudomonas putida]
MTDHARHSVTAGAVIRELQQCSITHVVTVPDMLQIAVHQALENPEHGIRQINCTTEDQAIEVSAGLWAGGVNSAIIVQNQGLYAGLNSLRALGLDSNVPMMFLIGQFGREWSNLGSEPSLSKRRVVYMLEPLLELLGIPYWRLDKPEDAKLISTAWAVCQERKGPVALILGHFVGFN